MRQDKNTIQTQLPIAQRQTAFFKKLKVAVIHDCYLHWGGAERVLENILAIFPQAEVYIPLIKKPFLKKLSQKHPVHTSIFNCLPLPEKYASFLKPFILFYWERLSLNRYDLVISSSHSFSAKSIKVKKPTVHLAYIYTPPRYLYQEFNEMNWLKKPFFKKLFSGLLNYLRKKDWQSAQAVDQIITISQVVQQRIKKYYGRDSQIIYPPVTPVKIKSINRSAKPPYYLFHSRLVKQKGAELVIHTFNHLGKPLLVVGIGPEEKYLRKIAKRNISFRGFVPDEQMPAIYAQSKALIYAAIEEDFGLVPLEAMSYGVPVIAFASGGVKETVIDQKTGLLFNEFSLKSLERAIKKFAKRTWSAQTCRRQAAKFSQVNFREQLLAIAQAQILKNTNLKKKTS